MNTARTTSQTTTVQIPSGRDALEGELQLVDGPQGIVLFAHGSGSSRHSPRNQHVAEVLRSFGMATLLFDLLTEVEESIDAYTGHLRFDIGLLARRLMAATEWVLRNPQTRSMRIGYFGASTGAAAALVAAAQLGDQIGAVVSRGGRPDLAGDALEQVTAPSLLIVGERDYPVIELNLKAMQKLRCEKELEIIPGATHLFEEPGTLDAAAQIAAQWFRRKLSTMLSTN